MGRWLVILSLAVVQCPDIAMASSKSSDLTLWKRLLSAFKPAPPPAPRDPAHRDKVQLVRTAATPNAAEPVTGSQADELTKSNKTDCNGGRQIISAFYSQGQHTASGQRFDPQGMTAAHRTLPFGTRLTVTNPRTGKSVTVVINDRGPFVSGVALDLSLGAAQAIGMHGTGSVCIW
jgi:rare lipoprotein A (peptidoglycan hydrolase)